MDYHLLTHIELGRPHRMSLPGDLDVAKRYAVENNPEAKAMLLFAGGGAAILGGTLLEAFAPESGWVSLAGDPLRWWSRLSPDVRAELVDDSRSLDESQVAALTTAGATVAGGYWVESESGLVLALPFADRVFITVASRLGI